MHRSLKVALVAAFLLGCVAVCFRYQRHARADAERPLLRGLAAWEHAEEATIPSSVEKNAAKPREPRVRFNPKRYSSQLDRICPPVSEEELQTVLAHFSDRPDVLAAIAFRRWGTPHATELLKQALRMAPEDPCVLAVALWSNLDEGNRLELARRLSKCPNCETTGILFLAAESVKTRDFDTARAALETASQLSQQQSVFSRITAAEREVFQFLGRGDAQIDARLLLDKAPNYSEILGDLVRGFSPALQAAPDRPAVSGSIGEHALLFDALDRTVLAQNPSFTDYISAVGTQIRILEETKPAAQDALSRYFSDYSEVVNQTSAEWENLSILRNYGADLAGLFLDLGQDGQARFLEVAATDGEIEAYKWLEEAYPQTFLNVIPQGNDPLEWRQWVTTRLKKLQ